jgi:hypothetical protein
MPAQSVVTLVIGVLALPVGIRQIARRNTLAARGASKNAAIQSPMAWVVQGGILSLMGLVFILAALL